MSADVVDNHLEGFALLSAGFTLDRVCDSVPVEVAKLRLTRAHGMKVAKHRTQAIASGLKDVTRLDSPRMIPSGLTVDDVKSESTA